VVADCLGDNRAPGQGITDVPDRGGFHLDAQDLASDALQAVEDLRILDHRVTGRDRTDVDPERRLRGKAIGVEHAILANHPLARIRQRQPAAHELHQLLLAQLADTICPVGTRVARAAGREHRRSRGV
jgi:hypothetical protein